MIDNTVFITLIIIIIVSAAILIVVGSMLTTFHKHRLIDDVIQSDLPIEVKRDMLPSLEFAVRPKL